MENLARCSICKSLSRVNDIDGECNICHLLTCINCKRICDRCLEIFCMKDIETRVVMRQQKPNLYKLCSICKEVWQ